MISGATGAIAVVAVSLVAEHGIEHLFVAVILMGLIQMSVGLFRLGKFIRLVPQPVIFGFVNGLGLIIFLSQLAYFKTTNATGETEWLTGLPLWVMVGFSVLTVGIIWFLPRLTKALPAPLTAIVLVTGIILGFGIDTQTVGDIAGIAGGWPQFHWPDVPLSLDTLVIVFPYAFIMAMVGLIESLLTLTVVDEMTETRGRGNKECVAQGAANFVTGFFGGMGGCAMIGQSIINVSSGARGRLSGILAAVTLLLFVLVGSSYIEQVPMVALVGLMFMVAIGTFEWASLRIIGRAPLTDVFVMVLVAGVTVWLHNLALAVLFGVVVSALAFAWENAKRIRARKRLDDDGTKHYEIYGPLFFGSTTAFQEKFDVENDPEHVVIDFAESRIVDHSAIESLNKVTERYAKAGKHIRLRHLSPDCVKLLGKAGRLVDVNLDEDPRYKVISDELSG